MWVLRYATMAVLAAAALGVLAFGPRGDAAVPKNRVIVDYWEKWTGTEARQMQDVVDLFNDTVGREKGIFVRYLSTSSINQKTLVATAAGVPPDIAGLWDQNVPQFAALDALEPLDAMAAAHGITPETYKPVFWAECSYDGTLYALASTSIDVGLYYNTRLYAERATELRAAGLDPDRAPRTIAELDAYSDVLTTRDASGNIVVAGYLPLEPGWYALYLPFWFGGSWWDDENKRFAFTDPAVVRAFEWVQAYYERLGPSAVSQFRSGVGNFDSPQNPFMAGTLSMVQQGTFLAAFIRNNRPSMAGDWAAAPFPAETTAMGEVTFCNTDLLVIPRGARHKAEAFEFIAFVNRQDVIERLNMTQCKLSPLSAVSDNYLRNHENPFIEVFERLAASPGARATPSVPILPQVVEEVGNMLGKLALMQTTPAEELPRVQARLQAKLNEFNDRQRNRRAGTSAAGDQ